MARAALVATAVLTLIGSSHPALADPTDPPMQAQDITAAYATAACDPDGTTSADAALATQLNSALDDKMRGYMTAYRVSCARMVIKAAHDRGLSKRAAAIAIATTIVESSIQNISEEVDHDSLGLFQQRASWGSASQRLNPVWATNAFLDKMIRVYPNGSWQTAPIGDVCQAVQVSAYPDRYQVEANDATIIVNAIWPSIDGPSGKASVYGVLADGRLTYTAIDAASGKRIEGAEVSSVALGFKAKALAALNYNTLLVTEEGTAGRLYRVDVISVKEGVTYSTPVLLGTGWTHDLLAYDGSNYLFGIADGALRRYKLTADKPVLANITGNTLVGSGFTLKTLTATGPSWILGTTSAGALISYKINGANSWQRYQLRDTTWQVFDHLLSPGGGVYYGHRIAEGSVHSYFDESPLDGQGDDLTGKGVVDAEGWTQLLLSAFPDSVT
jgi:hypothetical protein